MPIGMDEACSILEAVLEGEGVERPCRVSVSIVSDARMRRANVEWRDIDAPTDVISLECERPDDPDLAEGEPCELGDILLAPAHIERQALDFGTTAADELRIMLVHGMLHLLGYDHLSEADAERMEARQNAVLARIPTDAATLAITLTRHDDEGGPR